MKLSSWKRHLAEVREARARVLDLVDHVARARVADALVLRVVGDELRVAAVRAVKRAADRPQRRVAEAVVEQVVARRSSARSPGRGGRSSRCSAPYCGNGSDSISCTRHERQEVVLDDLLAAVAVGGLNQKFLTCGVVAALDRGTGAAPRRRTRPRRCRSRRRRPRIASSGWMIGWMPPQTMYVDGLSSRSALDDAARELRVAGHRREADQVGVLRGPARSRRPARRASGPCRPSRGPRPSTLR